MPIVQLNLSPSRRDLRWFAGLWWPAMCATIGLMLFRKFHLPATAISIWAGGGLLAVLGVIGPSLIRPWYAALMLLTYPIGWCVSHVVLAAVYFLVVTPIGWLVRRFHDPMTRRFEPAQPTYWTAREASRENHAVDFRYFFRYTKKWWLTPIVIVMFLFGLLVVLAGTGAAPFIYTLF
jgi:hypothetical protein